jgi:Ran GTPase-activating protein (RanGAP) involved in mRNA processing and transport
MDMAKNQTEFNQLIQDLKENQPNPLVHNGELRLGNQELNIEDIRDLAEALKDNETVTKIILAYNNIGSEGAEALANMLKDNNTITHVDLGHNNIGPEGAKALAKTLGLKVVTGKEKLIGLNLFDNKIGPEGTEQIAKAFFRSGEIQSINLGSNNIGTEGVKALGKLIVQNKSLIELDLSYNGITAENIKPITKALKVNKSLKELKLQGNRDIGLEGMDKITEAKVNKNIKVESIYNYFSYPVITPQGERDRADEKIVAALPSVKTINGVPTHTSEARKWIELVEKERPKRERQGKETDGRRRPRRP